MNLCEKKYQAGRRNSKWEIATEKKKPLKQANAMQSSCGKGTGSARKATAVNELALFVCMYVCMIYMYLFVVRCFYFILCNILLTLV